MLMNLQDKLVEGLDAVELLETYYGDITWVIAGGAVRDQIMEKPINDIDIYNNLNMKNKEVQKNFLKVLKSMFSDQLVDYPTTSYDSKYTRFHITALELKNGNKFEFISIPDKWSIVDTIESFDVGLCQASIYKNELWTSKQFKKDRENETLTLYPNRLTAGQIYRSVTYHIPKLKRKFPDHGLRISYE